MRPALLTALALTTFGCAAGPSARPLGIATITSAYTFGGEARFTGKLIERGGCLVATDGGSFATPIFDPGVTLSPDGRTIRDVRQGARVPVGRSFQAGAAWLRDDGQGWSVESIESFYGTRLPPNCPTDEVIRLHDFELEGEG